MFAGFYLRKGAEGEEAAWELRAISKEKENSLGQFEFDWNRVEKKQRQLESEFRW